jgi:hypothetical protein
MAAALALGSVVAVPNWSAEKEMTTSSPAYVRNAAEPSQGRSVLMTREHWRAGAREEAPLFGVLAQVLSDEEGRIYALDRQLSTVWVFGPDGGLLRSLSREGDGPGEARRPSDMAFLPDGTLGICRAHSGELVRLSLDGTALPSFRVGGPQANRGGGVWIEGVGCRGGSLVLLCQSISHAPGQQETSYYVARFDSDGQELCRYFKKVVVDDFANIRINEARNYYPRGRLWALGPDRRVYLAPERNEYRIHVYAENGALEMVIERDYEPVPRDPREKAASKKGYEKWYASVSSTIELEESEPAITRMMVDAEDYLWVLTSRGVVEQPDGIMATYDVFDREGQFVRQVAVAATGDGRLDDLFFLGGDRLLLVRGAFEATMAMRGTPLYLNDSEAAPMEIVCLEVLDS